jgi:hypothetical protein
MGSADAKQAVIWAIQDVRQHAAETVTSAVVSLSGLTPGRYRAVTWNPATGARTGSQTLVTRGSTADIPLPAFSLDAAVTLHRLDAGDVNSDGAVNEEDAALALQYAAGLLAPTAEQAAGADLSGDGAVDITDAANLARTALGGGE